MTVKGEVASSTISGGRKMKILRKVELIGGLITAILAGTYLLILVREDQQAAVQLEREFPLYRSIVIGLLLFVLPGLLVFVGSFFHSVKNRLGGQFAMSAGTLIIVAFFLLSFFTVGALYSLTAAFWIHMLLALFAVITMTCSLLVGTRP